MRHARRAWNLTLPIVLISLAGCASSTPSTPSAGSAATSVTASSTTLTLEERALDVQAFDHVWQTIKDKHWDPTLGGVDWDGAKAELRPRVEQATTHDDTRKAMGELIAKLGQSHFGVIPADAYADIDAKNAADAKAGTNASTSAAGTEPVTGVSTQTSTTATNSKFKGGKPIVPRGTDGSSGLELRVADGRAIVTRVRPGSPADLAGIPAGSVIESIDSERIGEALERVEAKIAGNRLHSVILIGIATQHLHGTVGDARTITFVTPTGERRTQTLLLGPPVGAPVELANIPGIRAQLDTSRLPSGIGYISLSSFFNPPSIMPAYNKAIAQMHDAPGLIIDLRGNPGGIGAMAMGMGGQLISDGKPNLGTMITRGGKLNFVINPQARPFVGPVAVLVDEMSMSTSEILAGGLQTLGRARVFGRKTPGAALPSVVERLPNGDGFQYAFADYVRTDGSRLEGEGVTPDEVIPLNPASFTTPGVDPVVQAAERWILHGGA